MTAPKALHLFQLQPGLDLFDVVRVLHCQKRQKKAPCRPRSCTTFGILTQDTHAENGLTSGTSIFGNIYQYMIPNRSKRKRFSSEILVNFQRKCVKISVTYERDLKIVKICQKYANF